MSDDYANNTGTTGILAVNGHINGVIETAGDVDWFKVTLLPGLAYRISAVTAQGTEPEIYVWNATRQWMEFSNMPGMLGSNELSNPFTYIFAGHEYYLQVSSQAATSYTLGLTIADDDHGDSSDAARPLAPGAGAQANFDYVFDSESYRIAATVGQTYTVTVVSDEIGSLAALRMAGPGDMVDGIWGERTLTYSFTAAESRDYTVYATMIGYNQPANPVRYQVSVTAADRTPPKVLEAEGTVDGPIRIVFDEAIHLGSGTIHIGDTAVAIGGAGVAIDGNTLVVDTAGWRMPGTYFITFDSGAVLDAHGNAVQSAGWAKVSDFSHGNLVRHQGSWLGYTLEGTAATDDIVLYNGKQAAFTLAGDKGTTIVTNAAGQQDRLTGIERLYFTEGTDAAALSLDGNLGQVFRLYQAAFDRTPDKGGLGYWLAANDDGMALASIAREFIDSPEFSALYGANPGDAAFVDALYRNILHRAGEAAGVDYWNGLLAKGADRANVLVTFSESVENVAAVTIGDGFAYTLY